MFKKVGLVICLLITTFFKLSADLPSTGYTVINDRSKLPILSPSLAQRKTQKIRLKNKLEAYLISDPTADVNGAMLSVKVGSWEDPTEHPGLAHFLEHMLFLGTKKYPNESEYEKFIAEHGGLANAFTTNNSTNYLFTINNNAFPEAISRFSSFFKEPLFNPSGVAREMQAINQEFSQNLEDDNIRQIFVLKELADPKHPYHHFSMGHSESLKNVSRQALEEWFRTHYSANLMKLVVFSSLPLDQLRSLVVEQFSPIINKEREPLHTGYPAFKSDLEKKFIYIEPIKDSRTLTLLWELPTKFSYTKESKPDHVVCYLLGHEGEKSLLAQLKREKLAENLACGSTKLGEDFTVLYLQIDLTSEGLRAVDQVITRCFQTIKNLKEQEIPSYVFNEIKNMETIEYQYPSKENEFMMLTKHAFDIQDEDISTYPEHTAVIQQFDRQGNEELVKYLTPQNAQFVIMAPSNSIGIKLDRRENWFGVQYALKPISKDLLDKWTQAESHEDINLPPPNIFIPADLKLVNDQFDPNNKLIPTPHLLAKDEKSVIYFARDTKFGEPKVSWTFTILTPMISSDSSEKIVLADLYVKNLKESLNKITYLAKIAGLEYDIKRENNGIMIKVEGYSQNAPRLMDEILLTIANFEPNMEDFRLHKESLLRKYQNFAKDRPVDQSVELFKSLLYKDFVTEKDKAIALRKATFTCFDDYVQALFKHTYVEGMMYGNMTETQAKTIVSQIKKRFEGGTYAKNDHLKNGVIILPKDKGPYYVESQTKAKGNAVLLAIENDTFTFKERAAQQILMQAIKEPFFTSLRTKQQTGYLVHSYSEEIERKLFNIFAVQSNTHDGRDLLSRFEQFIEGYLQEMGKVELKEEQFQNIKNALILQYEDPSKNIAKMGELLNTLAFEYDGDFDWVSKRVVGFRDLNYGEFLNIANNFIGRNNKQRLAILLRGTTPDKNIFSYTKARTWNTIRKLSEYDYREN